MDTPPLGPPHRVSPRNIAVGQYVFRERRYGHGGGWCRVTGTEWLAPRGRWRIDVAVPENQRAELTAYFHVTAQKHVQVRDVAPGLTSAIPDQSRGTDA
jgi:hypothetical protein